jgi:dihydropteroate synthase
MAELGLPLVVGPSRKSFLAAATGPLSAADRDWATAAAVTAAILGGAHIIRVHAVDKMVHVARVADALR